MRIAQHQRQVQGYDEEGWKSLGAQMRDGEAVKIKAKLPINVLALWIVIVAERDARLQQSQSPREKLLPLPLAQDHENDVITTRANGYAGQNGGRLRNRTERGDSRYARSHSRVEANV